MIVFSQGLTLAKHHTPDSLRVIARRAMLEGHNARLRMSVPVAARCEFDNVIHCAVRKSASQWINAVFSDPVIYRHSGLLPYVPRYYRWRHPQPFPTGRLTLSLFVSRGRFDTIPKPVAHRAFFVMRDPRDIVVSSYFSTRNSHAPMGDIPEQRKILKAKSFKEGMLHQIAQLARKGNTFPVMRSWAVAPASEPIRLVRYEDLTGERQTEALDALLRHCGIGVPTGELEALAERYCFTRMRGAHYRRGTAGDWRNHFDDEMYEAFHRVAGDLVDQLGYPPR